MSKALTLFDDKAFAVPAHLVDINEEGNILDRVTTPSLSYEGKTWSISINGEKTPLMKRDADGDEVPVAIMRVVVLDYNQRRGRSYYEGAYDPAKAAQPLCWSDDGDKPHASIKEPICRTCAECPMAVKGSKVSEQGKAVQACSQHRIVAVVPAHKMDMVPLRLKLAVTSDYDKENDLEAQGWFAFQSYRDFLKARGVNHTAMLVTKMRFDPNVAYPKVLFSPDRWVTPEEKGTINPLVKSDEVKKLLAGTWTPAGVEGVKIGGTPPDADEGDDGAAAAAEAARAEAAAAAEKKAKAAAARKAKAEAEAKAAADAAAAEAAKGASKATIILDDDDDEIVTPAAASKPKPAVTTAEVVDDLPSDVKDLMADWDDE